MQKFLTICQHPNTLAVVVMLLLWINTPSAWRTLKTATTATGARTATAAKQALPPRDALVAQYVQCTGEQPAETVSTKALNDAVWDCKRRQGRSV